MSAGAMQLLTALRSAGLTVRELDGWATRGGRWRADFPVGIMQHHTAPPVPFPPENLAGLTDGGRIKCNTNVKPDGTIWMIAYRAPNYSSGKGSSVTLDRAVAGDPPPANARELGLTDDMGGNDRFWGIETDHPGDGSPLPAAQRSALAAMSVIVAQHFALTSRNVVSHAEWTARKSDPFWDGNRRAIEAIRSDMKGLETMTGPNGEPNWDQVAPWAQGAWSWAWAQDPRLITPDSHPRDPVTVQELIVFLGRYDQATFYPG